MSDLIPLMIGCLQTGAEILVRALAWAFKILLGGKSSRHSTGEKAASSRRQTEIEARVFMGTAAIMSLVGICAGIAVYAIFGSFEWACAVTAFPITLGIFVAMLAIGDPWK